MEKKNVLFIYDILYLRHSDDAWNNTRHMGAE